VIGLGHAIVLRDAIVLREATVLREAIVLREATGADLPAIVALLADDVLGSGREELGPPLPEVYRAGFEAMTAQGGRIIVAVDAGAGDGGAVIGCLQLNILHGVSLRAMARAQVEGVRVAAGRRGQGVGEALMREAIRRARLQGATMMQLTTNLARKDAQRFYARLGFALSHAGMKLTLG
jgi:GNAT superfamily N-acetyltransferase